MKSKLKSILGGALLAASFSSPAGIITTYAGTGTAGYSGDGGSATNATLSPRGIAVDPAGNLYVAHLNRPVVRRVDHATGAITTVAAKDPEVMKAPTETAVAAVTNL